MLTIEPSAENTIQGICAFSIIGMSHYKRVIDENRAIMLVHNYLALVIYDCLLTVGSEVAFFWNLRRLNGAMILFLLNRYLTLAVQILRCIPSPLSFEVRCLAIPWLPIRSLIRSRGRDLDNPTCLSCILIRLQHCEDVLCLLCVRILAIFALGRYVEALYYALMILTTERSILCIKDIRIVSWALPVLHFSDGFLPFLDSMFLEYHSAYLKWCSE